MNRTITAVVCLFVVFGLAVSATPGKVPLRQLSTPISQASQTPVTPKTAVAVAWMLDGSQPPVPPTPPGGAA